MKTFRPNKLVRDGVYAAMIDADQRVVLREMDDDPWLEYYESMNLPNTGE